jgi:hypothetical protein
MKKRKEDSAFSIYDYWDGGLGAVRFRLGMSRDVVVVAAAAWSTESDIEWIGTHGKWWLELFVVLFIDLLLIASSYGGGISA